MLGRFSDNVHVGFRSHHKKRDVTQFSAGADQAQQLGAGHIGHVVVRDDKIYGDIIIFEKPPGFSTIGRLVKLLAEME